MKNLIELLDESKDINSRQEQEKVASAFVFSIAMIPFATGAFLMVKSIFGYWG